MNQEKLVMVKSMHEIVKSLNDETAYATWIYIMPDEPQEDDFEWFAEDENEESFSELVTTFLKLMQNYGKYGMYIAGKLYII